MLRNGRCKEEKASKLDENMPQFSVLSFMASDKFYDDPTGTPYYFSLIDIHIIYMCTYVRPTSFLAIGSFICLPSLPLG